MAEFYLVQYTRSSSQNIQVSQYGLYDALSGAMKKFVDGLHAVHTSRLQCKSYLTSSTIPGTLSGDSNCLADDMILDLWGAGPNRPPIDTHHPAVRTHPVTGLKALNVNTGFVTGFAELRKHESSLLFLNNEVMWKLMDRRQAT